jgi:hypothetical protein
MLEEKNCHLRTLYSEKILFRRQGEMKRDEKNFWSVDLGEKKKMRRKETS